MYIIGVYDIVGHKVNKVKKVFDKYLNRCQFSVYRGELTNSNFKKLKMEIDEIIDKDEDNVIFFILPNNKFISIEEIGNPKNNDDFII